MNDYPKPRLFTQPAWTADANCKHLTDLFYLDHGNTHAVKAKKICAECPVRIRCLEYAIDNQEEHGIWGGHTVRERRTIIRNRKAMGWTTGRHRHINKNGVA